MKQQIKMQQSGFTLIELMIVVTITALLASIAIPSYNSYVLRGKRSEGRALLLDTAALQERYYSDCNQFATTVGAASNCATSTFKANATSESGYYTLVTPIPLGGNNQSFTLTADPQFNDPECDNLGYTNAGVKTENGTSDVAGCWGK